VVSQQQILNQKISRVITNFFPLLLLNMSMPNEKVISIISMSASEIDNLIENFIASSRAQKDGNFEIYFEFAILQYYCLC